MDTSSLIKILETPCIVINNLHIKTRLVNLSFEIFTNSFREKDSDDQFKYSNCFFRYHGVNGYSIKFMVWVIGDRTILKNFVLEKSVETQKKKLFQFWKKDTIQSAIDNLLISDKDATQIVLDSFSEDVIKNLLNFCEKA